MKKVLFFAILACMFVSCSSDGSREIQIDEITFTPDEDFIKPNEIEKVASIFEVVPGTYELAWTKIQDAPQIQNYNVSLKLKLRLKRTVKFSEEFLNDISNEHNWFSGFDLCLLDADGKEDSDVYEFHFGAKGCTNDGTMFDRDEYMDFINFLQSNPGTEKEFELNSFGFVTSVEGVNCIEVCKNAKSVVCKIDTRDRDFERAIGVIE